MTTLAQIPEVQFMPVAALEQDFRVEAILDHVGRAPFAGDDGVESEMPPEIVGEVLRPSVHFPLSEDIEALRVHDEYSAGAVAIGCAEGAGVDPFKAAVDGGGRRVSGSRRQHFRLDYFYDLRFPWIGLGVDNVDAGGTNSGDDEIAALHVRMRRVGAQACAACVPTEVVQLVAWVWHVHTSNDLAVAG